MRSTTAAPRARDDSDYQGRSRRQTGFHCTVKHLAEDTYVHQGFSCRAKLSWGKKNLGYPLLNNSIPGTTSSIRGRTLDLSLLSQSVSGSKPRENQWPQVWGIVTLSHTQQRLNAWSYGHFCLFTGLEWHLRAFSGKRPGLTCCSWHLLQPQSSLSTCRQEQPFTRDGSRQALFLKAWGSGGLVIFVLPFFKFYFLNEQKAACNSLQLTAVMLQPKGLATLFGRDFVQ